MSPVDRPSRCGEDIDLGKGSTFHSNIWRTDIGVPRVCEDVNLDEEKMEEGHDGMARPDSG
jgi:hypothetical protein